MTSPLASSVVRCCLLRGLQPFKPPNRRRSSVGGAAVVVVALAVGLWRWRTGPAAKRRTRSRLSPRCHSGISAAPGGRVLHRRDDRLPHHRSREDPASRLIARAAVFRFKDQAIDPRRRDRSSARGTAPRQRPAIWRQGACQRPPRRRCDRRQRLGRGVRRHLKDVFVSRTRSGRIARRSSRSCRLPMSRRHRTPDDQRAGVRRLPAGPSIPQARRGLPRACCDIFEQAVQADPVRVRSGRAR